jgi:hypothetical protein
MDAPFHMYFFFDSPCDIDADSPWKVFISLADVFSYFLDLSLKRSSNFARIAGSSFHPAGRRQEQIYRHFARHSGPKKKVWP